MRLQRRALRTWTTGGIGDSQKRCQFRENGLIRRFRERVNRSWRGIASQANRAAQRMAWEQALGELSSDGMRGVP